MKGIIGIASVQDGIEERLQLPKVRIYVTQSGEYLFLDKTVLTEAIALKPQHFLTIERSLVLVATEILLISQRSQRRGGTAL